MAIKKSYLTSASLVKAVERDAMVPLHQNTFSEDDILDIATEEMMLEIVPAILKFHQDYFLTSMDVKLVQGKTRYAIPSNAVGDKLRDVSFVDTSSNVREMTRISVDQLAAYNYGTNTYPFAFYIEGNEIVLAPTRNSYMDGTLKISYYQRTLPLISDEHTAEILSIDRDNGVIQLSKIPDSFRSIDKYNYISSKSPFKTLMSSVSVVLNRDLNTIITTDIPESLAAGDYITFDGCSNIPQIPEDLHTYLKYRVIARVLESMNDTEALKNVYVKIQQLERSTTILIESRVDSAPEKIVNRHNSLRSGSYIRRRWRY